MNCNFIIISKLQVLSVNLKLLTKINPVESGYFWGKSWYFNEKSLKMENLRYVIVSSLYILYAYGPYCKLNPIENGVYILVEASIHISTTWRVSLLVDQGVPEDTCSQVLRSTSVDL